jgi:cold shock CspA family protein
MAKLMLFIDGTWLYKNNPRLSESYGDSNFRVDFGKLPTVLSEEIEKSLGTNTVDVVRTYLFGSYAINYDASDEPAAVRRRDFFDVLKEEYHYEVEIYPINYMGRRLRKADRIPSDSFEPKEKCVDIALATNMLYLAAIPYAYDIGVAIIGDRDFLPMLQNVRKLGKRVAIASIKGSCAEEFSDPRDEARVKDFDIIWIDDLLHKLELKYERHQLSCESTIHKGNRLVWTTYRPRKGHKFYCEACRNEYMQNKLATEKAIVSSGIQPNSEVVPANGSSMVCESKFEAKLNGIIVKNIPPKEIGFISATNGKDYYFHITDLMPGLEFKDAVEGLEVDFEVRREPTSDKAGAASRVARRII